jgi:hypothetical protein
VFDLFDVEAFDSHGVGSGVGENKVHLGLPDLIKDVWTVFWAFDFSNGGAGERGGLLEINFGFLLLSLKLT